MKDRLQLFVTFCEKTCDILGNICGKMGTFLKHGFTSKQEFSPDEESESQ